MSLSDKKIIDNIKGLALDMIDEAKSGHPGIVLGAAPILYTLFNKHLNINFNDPTWINKDRFILSAGHGSALLYATLFMAGSSLTIEDLKDFRQLNSKTPGHPEYNILQSIDMSTGPLGQGVASSVGFAIAQKHLESKFNIKKDKEYFNLFDYFTYCLCSDGDLMEGVSYEACSLAGTLGLGNLIILYDSNDISLDGKTSMTFREKVLDRFKAMGFHTIKVNNGESIEAIDKAIEKAKKVLNKPSIIEIKTIIGKGSINENTNKVHGSFLDKEDLKQIKKTLSLRDIPFIVSKEACEEFRNNIIVRVNKKYNEWQSIYEKYINIADDKTKALLNILINKNYENFDILKYKFNLDNNESMRDLAGKILNVIANNISLFMGGSVDLASSVKTYLNDLGDFTKENYKGRNIWFGVREHASASIINGIALSGIRAFTSTFLVFSDYMKAAIRMSCLMDLPVIYIFTHDTINIGEDGPTHQPVEQLIALRSIPNFNVYRPCDYKEIIGSFNEILKNNKPSALVLSRNNTSLLDKTDSILCANGAYIVRKEAKKLNGIILASGSEVEIALRVANELQKKNIDIRVISVPSLNTFKKQNQKYKKDLIPIGVKVIVIEFGSSMGWEGFVYNEKYLITQDCFGKSAKKDDLLSYFNLDYESILKRVYELLM